MSNTYSFYTDLLGPKADVEGTFHEGENQTLNCPGEDPSFEIETITINDVQFEIDCLSDETLSKLEAEAFAAATDEANQEPF